MDSNLRYGSEEGCYLDGTPEQQGFQSLFPGLEPFIKEIKVDLTCKEPSLRSSSSFCAAFNIPGTISPNTGAIWMALCLTTAATSCTVVLCCSVFAPGPNAGRTFVLRRSAKRSGDDAGTNCESVRIARLRTAGRGCESNGARTARGWSASGGLVTCEGKREMRIERIESVSIRVSGGVEDWSVSSAN